MFTTRLQREIVAVALVAGMMLAGQARAQGGSAQAGPIDEGKRLYTKYCASCHGVSGKGDGPMAKVLVGGKAPDLTMLAKNAGGKYPVVTVIQSIDGTNPIAGHGTMDMPVWGEQFNQTGLATSEYHAQTRGYIMLITQYLGTIQAK